MSLLKSIFKPNTPGNPVGMIPYGRNKPDGSHDHRSNHGVDRTPAQKSGDAKRKKP